MTNFRLAWRVGERLPPVSHTLTQAKINEFELVGRLLRGENAAQPPANIHTDAAKAQELGLEQPIASGQMAFAYLHELLARQFGIDFRQGGQLAVTFLKPICAGDTVTAQGVITETAERDGRVSLTIEVRLENQRGEKTAAGEGRVTIPSPLT